MITDIYKKYQIPPNLVRHQLEVASVGRYVCDHWTDSPIDKDLVTRALLLHDMGNIIKFKHPFLGELESHASYWEKVQQEFIKKYGRDVAHATDQILRELGFAAEAKIITEMTAFLSEMSESISDTVRICEFADCCVTPEGIVGYERRLLDLQVRYHHDENDVVMQNLRKNNSYVQNHVSCDLKDIQKQDFSKEIFSLSSASL